MKESTDLAWHCLGNLLSSPTVRTLAMGALDEKGERTYSKPKNIPQQLVYDLQMVIHQLDRSGPMGLPDGAFGENTANALLTVTGHPDYLADRDLPLLTTRVLRAHPQKS